ncbi:hypothetical protein ACW7BJ_12990 [Azospirillum argentinense]
MVLSQFEGRYLLVSAQHPALRTAFVEQFSKAARQRVCGAFSVEAHARPAEVATSAEPAQRAVEEREEVATIQRIIDAAPDSAAWGKRPTLQALYVGRVMTLAVDDRFAKPGARCGNCAALWETVIQHCPNCGSNAVEPVEDVVELALEKALAERRHSSWYAATGRDSCCATAARWRRCCADDAPGRRCSGGASHKGAWQ